MLVRSLLRGVLFVGVNVGLLVVLWISQGVWLEITDQAPHPHLGLGLLYVGAFLLMSTMIFVLGYIVLSLLLGVMPWYSGSMFTLIKKRELYMVVGYFVVIGGGLLASWYVPIFSEEMLPYVYFGSEIVLLVFLEVSIIRGFLKK